MTTTPTPSPYPAVDMNHAFPQLSAEQIDRIRPFGKVRKVEAEEILFQPGDGSVPFFVVLSGEMEIVQIDMTGERAIATHKAGSFTGELTMISGRGALVRGRVSVAGEFLELTPADFLSLVARDAELNEIFMRAFILRRLLLLSSGRGNVVLLGSRHSANTLRLREFLTRNGHPHTYIDLDTDKSAQSLLDQFAVKPEQIPVVICNKETVLRNPTTAELANCLGLNLSIEASQVRDVVIVGAGPAGLAAAVYAASEGLDVLMIETEAPGGQAGSSSRIENYLGFPTGVSGLELTARATTQAQKFGAKMMVASKVTQLKCDEHPYIVVLDDGREISARAVVLASGAHYNKPDLANLKQFEGLGIYYGATFIESQMCGGDEVIVVGGGNSAGQAAVFLSRTARKVYMLVRGKQLAETMSRYLIQRIEENPAIEMHYCTEIIKLDGKKQNGDEQLERVTWKNKNTGAEQTHDIRHVFIMAGASPRTNWLKGCLALDDKGFILTGRDLDEITTELAWPLRRGPLMLETSLPGVFAVGDIRSGSVKRVASAVGEGAIAVSLLHRVLAEL
jgi:thioredoxin reductase (NADPH)